jgi:arginine decarboxylase
VLTRGTGVHKEQLTAFELTVRDANIEQQDLVTVSSSLPPKCIELEIDAGVATLHPGEITFAVVARMDTKEPGRRISSSVGLARPSDPSLRSIKELNSILMLRVERRQSVYETSSLIIGSTSITAYAEGDRAGIRTCVVAAVVFRFP